MKNNTLNSLFVLIKKDILVTIGGMIHKKNKGRQVKSMLSMAVLALFVVGIIGFNSVMQTIAYASSAEPTYGIMMNFITATILGLMLSLMRVSVNQNTNDAQLLLSLPVSRNVVVISKTVSHYLYDLSPQAILLIPSIITYAIIQKSGVLLIFRGILVVLMIPLLFVAISYFLNSIMSALTKKFKFTNKIVTVLTMVLLMAYMLMMMSIGGSDGGTNSSNVMSMPLFSYFPYSAIKDFIFNSNLTSIIYFAAVTIIPFILSINIYARGFGNSNAVYKEKNKSLSFEQKSMSKTLFLKEIKRYFDSSIYVINTAVGPIMMILFVILIVFKIGPFGMLFTMPEIAKYRLIALIAMMSMFMGTSCTTASSISLEGKQLWILKTIPIDFNQLFLAKIKVNLIITIPFVIIGGATIAIAIGLNIIETVILIAVPSMVAVVISLCGIMFNLLLPKLDWTSEVIVVKQSMPVLYVMLIGFALTGVPIALYIFLASKIMEVALFYTIMVLIYVALALIVWRYIKTKGEKLIMDM